MTVFSKYIYYFLLLELGLPIQVVESIHVERRWSFQRDCLIKQLLKMVHELGLVHSESGASSITYTERPNKLLRVVIGSGLYRTLHVTVDQRWFYVVETSRRIVFRLEEVEIASNSLDWIEIIQRYIREKLQGEAVVHKIKFAVE